jgi:peptidoglycan pentaglycine glycine transferase (the first glycine)
LPRAVKNIQPTHNWHLNIEPTEEEILVGMKPKTRYNINLAQRKGVTVRVGEKKDLLVLWQLFLETATRNNIRLHSQNYYFQMWEQLSDGNLKILLAEYQGKPLAGIILTLFGDTATYLHGGSSQQMKEAMAPLMLHWEAIKLSKSSGHENL